MGRCIYGVVGCKERIKLLKQEVKLFFPFKKSLRVSQWQEEVGTAVSFLAPCCNFDDMLSGAPGLGDATTAQDTQWLLRPEFSDSLKVSPKTHPAFSPFSVAA